VTEAPPPAMSVDERQDAKIARGLASSAEGGLLVASAPPASVAAALRLQPGDVILTVNGSAVSTPADFVRIYREQGMPSELTIMRAGREMHVH
jgi:S1-C subfamily serine protease